MSLHAQRQRMRAAVKRSGGLTRHTALVSRSTLNRSNSRIANREPAQTRPRRPDTGPPERIRKLVRARSGGQCEWPDCGAMATDVQHRLGRKVGGRRGEMRERLNGAAWLAHCCRQHHEFITNPVGVDRVLVEESGWLLREGMDARVVPILTRHSLSLVLFDDLGDWQPVSA